MRAIWLIALVSLIGSIPASAETQVEDFVYDPNTDTYILTFWGKETGTPVFERWVFVPHTRIVPTVKSKVEETDKGVLRYSYRLRNGKESKQNLSSIDFLASHAIKVSQTTPKGWFGGVVSNSNTPEFIISWFLRGPFGSGLTPGKSQSGFAYDSTDLPGMSEARMAGAAFPIKSDTPASSLPNPDSEATRKLEEFKARDYVPRVVAAPRIANPTPFNAAVVLEGVRSHLNGDLQQMKLVDPVFAAQLDRPLGAAIDAAKVGNTAGAKDNLKQFRKLLKQEHEDADREDDKDFDSDEDEKTNQGKPRLIDKLAARVLDFDAKYVLKRLGGD